MQVNYFEPLPCRITTSSEGNTPLTDECSSVSAGDLHGSSKKCASKLQHQVNGVMSSPVIHKGFIFSYLTFGFIGLFLNCVVKSVVSVKSRRSGMYYMYVAFISNACHLHRV